MCLAGWRDWTANTIIEDPGVCAKEDPAMLFRVTFPLATTRGPYWSSTNDYARHNEAWGLLGVSLEMSQNRESARESGRFL